MKLGKKLPKIDPRTLRLGTYLSTLPSYPSWINWGSKVRYWGEMKNDAIGDCTIAATGHAIELWSYDESGQEIVVPDTQIVQAYSAVTGEEGAAYDPTNGANDNGCAILDVLNYFRSTGIGGQKIDAYASVHPKNFSHIKAAIYLFGCVDIGLQLPVSAQSQVGHVWDVPAGGPVGDGAPGGWGGHSVILNSYSSAGLSCITWGAPQVMTWAFLSEYCDEAYAPISPLWTAKKGISPSDLNLQQLLADAKLL
jgi:hypothetical protein